MIIKYKTISIICNNNFGKRRYIQTKVQCGHKKCSGTHTIYDMTENRIPTSIFSNAYFEMLSMSSCKIVYISNHEIGVLEAKNLDQVIIVLICYLLYNYVC